MVGINWKLTLLLTLLGVMAASLLGGGVGLLLHRTTTAPQSVPQATLPVIQTPPPPQPPTSSTPPARDTGVDAVVRSVDGDRLLAHVRQLSQTIGSRPVGSRAEQDAAAYVEKEFRSYGYQTKLQSFTLKRQKLTATNVLAFLPASKKPALVVAAHHDSVRSARGANDNASGVAVLLEVARIARQYKLPFDVTFASFSAEEISHDGSKYYIRSLTNNPRGMIDLDMVGVGSFFQIGDWKDPDPWLMHHCQRACDYLQIARQLDPPFGGKSDYASFAAAGIPIACYAWDPDPNMHTGMDRLESLNKAAFQSHLIDTTRAVLIALLTPDAGGGPNTVK